MTHPTPNAATMFFANEETAGEAAILYRGRLKYVGGRFPWRVTFDPMEVM